MLLGVKTPLSISLRRRRVRVPNRYSDLWLATQEVDGKLLSVGPNMMPVSGLTIAADVRTGTYRCQCFLGQ